MKTTNAKELNEKFRDFPTHTTEVEVEGKKYIVVSHFTGQKDLDNEIYQNAYSQAMNEILNT